jgi:hypothetical protein
VQLGTGLGWHEARCTDTRVTMVQLIPKSTTTQHRRKDTSASGDAALSRVADSYELYVTQHVQSVFRPGAKWRCPGVQIDAGGFISGRPGGDFYIAALGRHNEVSLAVGTVNGSGLLPTLCKALIAGLIHLQARQASSPLVVVQKVSSLLGEFNMNTPRVPVLCSVFVVLIDRRRETFEYCRAGDCRPFLQTEGGEWIELPSTCRGLGYAAKTDTDTHALVMEASQIERLAVITAGCSGNGKGTTNNVDAALLSSIPCGSASRQVRAMLAKICPERYHGACPEREVSVVVADLRYSEDSDAPATTSPC